MRKITIENVFEKEQHVSILEVLRQYSEGLTLHELTYLLSTGKLTKNYYKLQERFGRYRKNIFSSKEPRKRINDCLNVLKSFTLIIKNNKKYQLTTLSPELLSLIGNNNILKLHSLCAQDKNQELHNFFKKYQNIFFDSIIRDDIQIYPHLINSISAKGKGKIHNIIQKLEQNLKELSNVVEKQSTLPLDKRGSDARKAFIECVKRDRDLMIVLHTNKKAVHHFIDQKYLQEQYLQSQIK